MYIEENKRLKMTITKLKKYKSMVQSSQSKQEKEQLKRTIEMVTKEKDMYKRERENLNTDNARLRKSLQDMVTQNNMLKRQVAILEQNDEVTNEQKLDTVREKLEFEIERMKKDLVKEIGKNEKLDKVIEGANLQKEKAEQERNRVIQELEALKKKFKDLQKDGNRWETQKKGQQEDEKVVKERTDIKVEKKIEGFGVRETSKKEVLRYQKDDQQNVIHEEEPITEFYYDNYKEDEQHELQEEVEQSPAKMTNKQKHQTASRLFSSDSAKINNSQNYDDNEWTQPAENLEMERYEEENDAKSLSNSNLDFNQISNNYTNNTEVFEVEEVTGNSAEDFFSNLYQASTKQPNTSRVHSNETIYQPPVESKPVAKQPVVIPNQQTGKFFNELLYLAKAVNVARQPVNKGLINKKKVIPKNLFG